MVIRALIIVFLSTIFFVDIASAESPLLKGTVQDGHIQRRRIERDTQEDPGNVNFDASRGRISSPMHPRNRRIISREEPLPAKKVEVPKIVNLNDLVAEFDDSYEPSTFDIGVDKNSAELVLAWEKWHKQLCKTIYYRTMRRSDAAGNGYATVSIVVTRDNRISAELLMQSGSPVIARAFLDAINSMDANPGLSFPSKSQRNRVTFSYSTLRARNITPGYSWIKNDYETVRYDE